MVRDPCVALFALLNWFGHAIWLLGLIGSVIPHGCSVTVVQSDYRAASLVWFCQSLWLLLILWFFPLFWLLGLSGSFRLAGCSVSLVLSMGRAAHLD